MNWQLFSQRIWRILSAALLFGICLSTTGVIPVSALDANSYFNIVYNTVLSSQEIHNGDPLSLTVTGTVTCTSDLPLSVSEAFIRGKVMAKHALSNDIIVLNPVYNLTINPFPKEKGDSIEQSVVLDLSFPLNSPPGQYTILGELIEARVKALLWFTVTEYLPRLQEFTSVVVRPKSEPVVNPTPEPPDSPVQPATMHFHGIIDSQGNVTKNITIFSGDNNCIINIPTNVKAFNKDGLPLPEITITPISNPPSPPKGSRIIGVAYELAPEKAIFDPSIMLKFTFDKSQIPEGSTTDNLVIATFDQAQGIWVTLAESIVDETTYTISSPITHFSLFAVLSRHSNDNDNNPADSGQSITTHLPGKQEPNYTAPTNGKPGSPIEITRIPATTIVEIPDSNILNPYSRWWQIVFIIGVNLVLITIVLIIWKSHSSTHS